MIGQAQPELTPSRRQKTGPDDASSGWNCQKWPSRSQNWMFVYFIIILSRSQQFSTSSSQNQVELGEWATGHFMHCARSQGIRIHVTCTCVDIVIYDIKLKISSAKYQPFCWDLNVLIYFRSCSDSSVSVAQWRASILTWLPWRLTCWCTVSTVFPATNKFACWRIWNIYWSGNDWSPHRTACKQSDCIDGLVQDCGNSSALLYD